MRLASWAGIGALHIGQIAGAFAPDTVKDFVERTNLAGLHALTGPERLRKCLVGRRGRAQQKHEQYGRNITHGLAF